MTLGELILGAFDLALEFARKRVRAAAGIVDDPRVTREDFEQAIIALRFDAMGLTLGQIDAANEMHRRHMAELAERWEAEKLAGNAPTVEVVAPTGDEPTSQPYRHDDED